MNQKAHPEHPVAPEIAEALRPNNHLEEEAAARRFELATLSRPSDEERAFKGTLQEALLKSQGIDPSQYRSDSLGVKKTRLDRIDNSDVPALQTYLELSPMDFEPPRPQRSDPNFWAADWNFSGTPPFTLEALPDGFHVRGKKTYDGGDLLFLSFSERARYELHFDRIPRPDRPPWRSAPHVELFGELMAWTADGDIFTGDCWSKCWMIRRQTLVQHIFGGTAKIGEAIEVQHIFNEEDGNRTVTHRLPGFQPMPPVVLNSIFGSASIWAELEIRFEIQLEGSSLFWIHPFDLVIRGFQWPLIPL